MKFHLTIIHDPLLPGQLVLLLRPDYLRNVPRSSVASRPPLSAMSWQQVHSFLDHTLASFSRAC